MNIKNTKWYARKAYRAARRPVLSAFYWAKESGALATYVAVLAALMSVDAVTGVLSWIASLI